MCVLCVAGHKRVTPLVAQEVPWEVLHGFPEAIAGARAAKSWGEGGQGRPSRGLRWRRRDTKGGGR